MPMQKRQYIVTWISISTIKDTFDKDWVICESLDEAVELYEDLNKQEVSMLCISHIVKSAVVSV